MKLILLPLAVLVIVSILSIAGLGSNQLGNLNWAAYEITGASGYTYTIYADTVYYDYGGHPVVYANLTAVGEAGTIYEVEYSYTAAWNNGTFPNNFDLYYDTSHQDNVMYRDAVASDISGGKGNQNQHANMQFNLGNSIGFIAGVAGLMLLVSIVGARFLTYGQSEIGVDAIFKGTGFVGIWIVFSVLALPLMYQTPLNYLYFVLTLIYTLGIINSVGHPSGD